MVIVNTEKGKIKGIQESTYQCFLGIPYAKPPIGELRFEKPQPMDPWSEVIDSLKYGNIAPQHQKDDPPLDQPGDENCLYLNIWTPSADNERRPVMVWIHGGGFLIEAGARPRTDGSKLCSHGNIVVVSFNYRLGSLGFLNLPGIPSNLGIRDQLSALKWVVQNIDHFGGDPNNITIFGESAGGASVSILLASPLAKGLFHRAICQSGAANTLDFEEESARAGALRFIKKLGVSLDHLEFLRELPLEKILAVQRKIVGNLLDVKKSPFRPFIDGDVIIKQPMEIFRNGEGNNVPLIMGHNRGELAVLSTILKEAGRVKRELIIKYMKAQFKKSGVNKEHLGKLLRAYKELFASIDPGNPFRHWDELMADFLFKVPILRQLGAYSKHESKTYYYIFDYNSPKFKTALHTFEIPFVFGTIDANDLANGAIESNIYAKNLTGMMMDTWITFARTGNPNHEGFPNWSSYGSEGNPVMMLEKNPRIMLTNNDPIRVIWKMIESD
jgi:para-nitrobenzyl esterase